MNPENDQMKNLSLLVGQILGAKEADGGVRISNPSIREKMVERVVEEVWPSIVAACEQVVNDAAKALMREFSQGGANTTSRRKPVLNQDAGSLRGPGHFVIPSNIDADWNHKQQVFGPDSSRKRLWHGDPEGPIGLVGVAMALHRYLLLTPTPLGAGKFGIRLSENIERLQKPHQRSAYLDAAHLRKWVQKSQIPAVPHDDCRTLVLNGLKAFASQAGLNENAVGLLGQEWQKPSDLLAQLSDASPHEPKTKQRAEIIKGLAVSG